MDKPPLPPKPKTKVRPKLTSYEQELLDKLKASVKAKPKTKSAPARSRARGGQALAKPTDAKPKTRSRQPAASRSDNKPGPSSRKAAQSRRKADQATIKRWGTKAGPALEASQLQEQLPLVPLRDNVVFPFQLAPLAAGRPRSVAALEAAVANDGRVILAVQRSSQLDEVSMDDLYPIAVIANVGAFRRLPPDGAQALVEGQERVRLVSFEASGSAWQAVVEPVMEVTDESAKTYALSSSARDIFVDYVNAGAPVGPEVVAALSRATGPARIADIVSSAPDLAIEDRVNLLQEIDVGKRLADLIPLLARQVEVAQLRSRIQEDVQKTLTKGQREHILREQLKAIRKELAEIDGTPKEDEEDLTTRVNQAGMPEGVKARALKEVARLEQIPGASPELGMVRTYVDWLLELPWGDPPPDNVDITKAQEILDEDHYGLPKVKDRILEWLAVRERAQAKANAVPENKTDTASDKASVDHKANDNGKTKHDKTTKPKRPLQTPILCFIGPPGVGKTSLGRSIARALDRKFARMSLGGIRDEAEIRGHRRTYIGALPGRIIQSMKQAGTRNPIIMLDEIDKVGMDFRGDPSAALLEVLDPEQNCEFSDHYLEVPYDLSQVLFITTANLAERISPPLLDRMEIIRMNGYTEEEKIGIAEQHLVNRQREQHGLDEGELQITREALADILRGYTREAGVRQLDRMIAQICRKVPRRLSAEGLDGVVVKPEDIHYYLGPQRFDFGEAETEDQIGAATGVVVSEVGGDISAIEALAIEGRTDLMLTGQLGSVMEESARAALSWARVHGEKYGVPKDFFDNHGLHIHVPAGAIPKDGPSAGITIATALISTASARPIARDIAMTGEITLRGRVLPIGGVKDKLLAVHRAGLKRFILPRKNLRDVEEIEQDILSAIEIIPVDDISQVLDIALLNVADDQDKRRRQRPVGFAWHNEPPSSPIRA